MAAKDGVVLARYVNSRVTVAPGQRVLRFADTSLMSVELGLPDRLIGRLTRGQGSAGGGLGAGGAATLPWPRFRGGSSGQQPRVGYFAS